MNTILICNFILLLTLMSTSAQTKTTMTDLYNSFMKLEREHEEVCLKENNLSEAVVDAVAQSGVFPDNRDFKCFLNCMLIKSKAMNEKGELLLDNMKEASKAINIKFLEKFISDCTSKITETDPCERAALIDMCFTEEIKIILSEQNK